VAQPSISNPINILVNKSIESSIFPDNLKAALFKKKNSLDKGNYRPVNVLPCISKIYERAIHDQLMDVLDKHFLPLLSAFRPGFGCQTALLKIIEDWKKALGDNTFIAAILMDLSKAFDCLPHNLLLLKLEAFGLSKNSLILLQSYLENRKQRIKIGSYYTDWDQMCKGVPQCSILGPVLFNVFINDIFLFVQNSTIYNYADDNTVSYCDYYINKVVNTLEADSLKLINWLSINLMKAIPDKFQAIAIAKKTTTQKLTFNLNGNNITCEDNVKLLGVIIDSDLNSGIVYLKFVNKKSIKAAKYFETDW
jgi:retron-type reverse transcriptase